MATWRRWARAGVSIFGKVLGAGVALSPTFRGIREMTEGKIEQGFDSIAFDTAGLIPSKGVVAPDFKKVAGTVVVAALGIGIMVLVSKLARRI